MLFLAEILSAQQSDSLWQLQVDTVVVRERQHKRTSDVSVATRSTTFGMDVLESNRTRSLSELLSENSSVAIKSLGQGALSTASFRGTASSHTKVNWNGITLNPSMSNTFDFSQLPVFFTDEVVLYHGSGHLKEGTGALGGSINVSNAPNWNDNTRLEAFAEAGSFNTYTGAVTVRLLRKNALYVTRLYYQESENDYKYINKVLHLEDFRERRKEAKYHQIGVMQEGYFRLKNDAVISSSLWMMTGKRRLPQPIMVNVTHHERNTDYSLNYYIGYDQQKGAHQFSAKAAYLLNIMEHLRWFDHEAFDPKKNFNRMQSIQLKADYSYIPSDRLETGVSAKYTRNIAYAHSPDSILAEDGVTKIRQKWDKSRDVVNLQGHLRWNPLHWLTWDGQVMGEWNDSEYATTYSTGVAAEILPSTLTLKAGAAYNYKFPSLNDLYWIPGGNPELDPEKGPSYDVTLTYTQKIGKPLYLKAEVSAYRMHIDNWIMWMPNGNSPIWSPVNINKVRSQGVEVLFKGDLILDRIKFGLIANYAYTASENRKKQFEEDATYHKQLPYIPLNKANARVSVEWKNIYLAYQTVYNGKRYTSMDESYETTGYTIHNAELKYSWKLKGCTLVPKLSVNNIFDAYYESTQYYPMPLRTFLVSLSLKF